MSASGVCERANWDFCSCFSTRSWCVTVLRAARSCSRTFPAHRRVEERKPRNRTHRKTKKKMYELPKRYEDTRRATENNSQKYELPKTYEDTRRATEKTTQNILPVPGVCRTSSPPGTRGFFSGLGRCGQSTSGQTSRSTTNCGNVFPQKP